MRSYGGPEALEVIDVPPRNRGGDKCGFESRLGGFVVELAAMRGLRVVAAAGGDDEKFVGGVDAASDAVVLGYPALDAGRADGSFAVFVGSGPVPLRGIRVVPVVIYADGAALTGLSALAVSGKLTLRVADTYALPTQPAHRRVCRPEE